MRTFIWSIDERSGHITYIKYYISNHFFGTAILERYIARFILKQPLEDCQEFIRSRIYVSRSQERCYFEYHEQDRTYAANMTTFDIDKADRIIMSLPDVHYLIVVDDDGEERDM